MKKTRKYLSILLVLICTIFGILTIPTNVTAGITSSINTVNITLQLPADGQKTDYISSDDIEYESDPEEAVWYCNIEDFYHDFGGSLMGMSSVEKFEAGGSYCLKLELSSDSYCPFASSTCIYVNGTKCNFDILEGGEGAEVKYYFTCPSSKKTEPQVSDFDFTAPTNSTYDNSSKAPTLAPKTTITGMGVVTLKYATSLTSEEWIASSPINAGTYYVKACIAEGETYSEKELTDESWKFTINPTVLSISWDTTSFEYDGSAKKPVGTYDILGNDEVTVTISGEAIDVGNHKATVSLSGADAGNYTLASNEVEFIILQKAITVTGTTADEKHYDGTDEAVIHLGETSDIIEGDDVTITPIGKFSSVDVGNGIEVTIMYELTGEKALNYTIADDTTVADIVPTILTISNLVVEDKDYDGTTKAKCSYDVEGKIVGDDVKVTATAEFIDATAGNGKEVNISFEITGAAAANYTIAAGISSANISKATPNFEIPTFEATEGDTLADIKLPEGFSFEDGLTTSVGNAGNNTFALTYTPSDTDNYKTVTDIECTITVKEASKPDTGEDKSNDPIEDDSKEEQKEKSNGWIAIPIVLVSLLGTYGIGFYLYSKGKLTGKVFNILFSWLKKILSKK